MATEKAPSTPALIVWKVVEQQANCNDPLVPMIERCFQDIGKKVDQPIPFRSQTVIQGH